MTCAAVVVEYDCISPAGSDLKDSWSKLSKNGSGISIISRYNPDDTGLFGLGAVCYGGQIPLSYEDLARGAENFQKWAEPAYHAVTLLCQRVLKKIAFDISHHDPQRIAFLGGSALTSQYSRDLLTRTGKPDSKYILNQCHNIPLATAASQVGIQGPCFSVGSACASSGHAVLLASQFITNGLVDSAIVVGHEFPLMPFSIGGLDWVNALYRRDSNPDRGYAEAAKASRPFSQDRRGFIPAEAAGAVFLSHREYAKKMGWPIRGFVRGAHCNSDADHLTRPMLANIARCMHKALDNAGCNAEDVQCINAHATSTPVGDATEIKALYEVFGEHLKRTPVVANKSQIGHSLGAASIMGLIFALHGMLNNVALPTLNYVPDPTLPSAFISAEAIEHRHRLTLLNSFGFGGTNVSMVLEAGAA